MKRLSVLFLLFLFDQICFAKAPVEPDVVDLLSGFRAVRVVNDISYCATEGGLRIYDVKDRTNPRVLSDIIVSESSNVAMEIAGSYLYMLSGYIYLEKPYITVVDIKDPAQPEIISRYTDLEEAQVTDLLIHDRLLLVANGENIDFLDTTEPAHLKRVSRITITSQEGSVRGMAVYDKTLFAVWLNLSDSALDAVDISDINQPKKLVTYYYPRFNGFSRPTGGLTLSGSTLYVAVPTLGLLIFDAKTPKYLVPVTSMEGEVFYGVDAVHSEGNLLFLDLYNFGLNDIGIFDLSNPASPSLIIQTTLSATVSGMDYDANRREAYIGIYPAAGYGMGIFQLTQSGALDLLSQHSVPGPRDVAVSKGRVFLTASDSLIAGKIINGKLQVLSSLPVSGETGPMKVERKRAYIITSDDSSRSFLNTVDISNPAEMKNLGKFRLSDVPAYLAQDTFDVEGTRLYLAGSKGLSILDGSDSDRKQLIGFFPIEESLGTGVVDVEEGIAYVGTLHPIGTGIETRVTLDLRVIDVRNPRAPELIAKQAVAFATVATDIAVKDGYAYLLFAGFGFGGFLPVGDGRLAVVDVRTSSPEVLFSGYTRKGGKGYAEEIAIEGDTAFIADGLEGVTVLSLADKSKPKILATLGGPGHARAVSIDQEGRIHVADSISYLVYQWP